MENIIVLLIVITLFGCSSEKSETTSSSDFIYNISSLSFTIYPDIERGSFTGLVGEIDLSNKTTDLSLSDNDQLNLIGPTGAVIKGKNSTIAYSSELECCNFGGRDNRSLTEIQANNTWRVELKRQGVVEDSFDIQFPIPINIENPQSLSVSPEQDFILKLKGVHSKGDINVTVESSCFDTNTKIYIELKEIEDTVTVPVGYTAGCVDPDAKVLISFNAIGKTNPTTDLLNVPINGTPNLIQHMELPLKIN
jgi:hypothetical protein